MSTFARKFDLTSLEKRPPAWWVALLNLWAPSGSQRQGGLRFAVRDGYCNFYIQGQSVGRINHDQQRNPRMQVSKKYADGKTAPVRDCVVYRADDEPDVPALIAKATLDNRSEEKRFVDELVGSNIDVIDLEMGLPASYLGGSVSRRIDLVSLERRDDKILLVFWEVKLSRDGRLVSQTEAEIFEQMARYRFFLEKASQDVIKAYANACATLAAVHTTAKALRPDIEPLSSLLREVVANPSILDVDTTPRLLVFGEADERKRGHLAKLAQKEALLHIEPAQPLQLRFVAAKGS